MIPEWLDYIIAGIIGIIILYVILRCRNLEEWGEESGEDEYYEE